MREPLGSVWGWINIMGGSAGNWDSLGNLENSEIRERGRITGLPSLSIDLSEGSSERLPFRAGRRSSFLTAAGLGQTLLISLSQPLMTDRCIGSFLQRQLLFDDKTFAEKTTRLGLLQIMLAILEDSVRKAYRMQLFIIRLNRLIVKIITNINGSYLYTYTKGQIIFFLMIVVINNFGKHFSGSHRKSDCLVCQICPIGA